MDNLPSTIYIAIGTIIAALVSAAISIINAILSKELKLSELRQSWIDELRIELSSIISLINKQAVSWYTEEKKDEDNRKAFIKYHLNDIQELDAIIHKLLMRLNPKEHKVLIEYLMELDAYSADTDLLSNESELHELFGNFTVESNRVLKAEWLRVKSGEGSYRTMITIFKWVIYISIGLLVLITIVA
jgi:hypothetical protein